MKNYLGIDIGGTNIKYALLDRAGNILEQDKVKTAQNKEDFLNEIDKIVDKYHSQIKGIAFCAPGRIVDSTIYLGGALPFIDGINLGKRYQDLDIPVAGINDGKASVLAENWLGNLKDLDNCGALTLGTGVGGGLIVNGKLVAGEHAQAGEISFMRVDPNQDDFNGYAGTIGSAVGMISRVNQAVGNQDLQDGLAAFKAIESGNQKAQDIFKNYCQNIAGIIFNIQSVIDLEKIAIGGGISAQPIVIEEINNQYQKLIHSHELITKTLIPVKIVAAKFKNDANIYGALYNLLLKINQEAL
ncbi:putative NBD/HSP70 family sugar kinase [Lactobacillus colini]|uniref:NBD/HSP70 family sugar kinase n=1 Tax=Lactobacillus colini TaxID=1819254 RepID=A0ABS4MG27_9LACO|nr:ROK family protein [Lactobacillus colini]MBP2058643.1 putative NBD/HSP70 family sugar kinase [Lactobacillus colini]